MKRILIVIGLLILTAGSVSAEYAKIRKIELSQSSGGIGQPVTITVTADGTNLKYKFWINTADFNTLPNNPRWVLLQNWSSSNAYTWTPSLLGLHTVVVWVSYYASDLACNLIGLGYNVTQGTQPPPPTQYMSDKLFGYWHFWYTIINTWHDYFDLNKREYLNDQGDYFISGTDQFGGIVVATWWPDNGYFMLLNPGIIIDEVFVFNLSTAGDTITSGSYYQADPNTHEITSNPYPLSGTKIHSNPVRSMQAVDQLTVESLKRWEAEESKKIEVDESDRFVSDLNEADVLSKYLELKGIIE